MGNNDACAEDAGEQAYECFSVHKDYMDNNRFAYDWHTIRGYAENIPLHNEIHEILTNRPVGWDKETVSMMFTNRFYPPLVAVTDVIESLEYPKADCIFLHPDGSITKRIYLAVSWLNLWYKDWAKRVVRPSANDWE